MPAGGEARHVADVPEQPCRARGADAVELEQGAAGGGDKLAELFGGDLDFPVSSVELDDELRGQLAARLAHVISGSHGAQQRLERLRPTRDQLGQQSVQPVDRQRAGCAQLVTSVDQQVQRDGGVIDLYGP